MRSKIRARLMVSALASMALIVPTQALAAEGDPHGGGGGGGGGGETTGSLYSDLVLALRATNGTPILKKYVVPATTEAEATTEYCVQPVSYAAVPGVTGRTNPVNGQTVWLIPLQGEWLPGEARADDPNALPADELGACDPIPAYAAFVSEVELERLNLARTSDDVIAQKVADVQTKLQFADVIALESTGRLIWDGTPIDASPENAGIYQSLMKTGTIPGLHPASMAGPPALVGPAPVGDSNSQFDSWELAAMAIGAAASKSTPINVDTVEYYNRIIGLPDFTSLWSDVTLVQPEDPDNPGSTLATGEKFVDYSGFSYNRSETFKGSVTWLDVPSLTWKVSHITEVVPFTHPEIGTTTLTGVKAFAQLADDVRALCNFIPDNTFIPGFYMDVPGVDTYDKQVKAIHDPAVDLGTLPETVFKTYPFQITASLLNPWAGTQIDDARLRLTVHAPASFAAGDVTATAPDGQSVPFTVEGGNLVGWWGPDTGFPVAPGYNVSTTFDVTVADSAPSGVYDLTLDLVKASDPSTSLAQETGSITVNDNVATVLWASAPSKLVVQDSPFTVPVTVYSPGDGEADLTFALSGPGDDPTTDLVEELKAGDAKAYASNGTDMVAMPLTLEGGRLVGSWHTTLAPGYNPVTWYVTIVSGALVGNYSLDVGLVGGNQVAATITVAAPESHGQQPPDAGDDTTAPVVTITTVGTLSADASFTLTADEPALWDVRLVTNDVLGAWESTTTPDKTLVKSYSGLAPGTYTLQAHATDAAGNKSGLYQKTWVVLPSPSQEAATPDTGIASGPADGAWVLAKKVAYIATSTQPGSAYIVTLDGRYVGTSATDHVVVSGLRPGAHRITIRAVANGLADPTPVVREVLVPRGVASMTHTRAWKMLRGDGHLFGRYAQTRREGQTFQVRSQAIKQIVLVAGEGVGNGKVRVYLNGRPISTVSLRAPAGEGMVLIPVRTFRKVQHGLITVKVLSTGKVVQLEGIGVASR